MDGRKKRYNEKNENQRRIRRRERGDCRFMEGGIPELLQGYSSEKIWNLNGTACSWRAQPDHGFSKRGSQCKGGKKGKTALIANVDGEAKQLSSFGNLKIQGNRVSNVPAQYFSQPKGWMTGEILDTVLSKLSQQLRSKGCSIALLMDNAGCHPPEIKHKYRNFKMVFLPPNTTAKLQFKHYPELQGPLTKTNFAFRNFKD